MEPDVDEELEETQHDGAALAALCVICLKNPKAGNQSYCYSPCAADVKAAERDAKRQGKDALQAFRLLKKRGNAQFRDCVMTYKAKCQSCGRGHQRPSFDWVRYYMAVEASTNLRKGSKFIWMAQKQFSKFMSDSEGMLEGDSILEFKKRVNGAKEGEVNNEDGVTRLLIKSEDFIITEDVLANKETVEYGTKDKKNPTDADILDRMDYMGKERLLCLTIMMSNYCVNKCVRTPSTVRTCWSIHWCTGDVCLCVHCSCEHV